MKIVLSTFCVLFIGTSTSFDYTLQQVFPVNGLRFQRKNLDFCVDRVPKSDNNDDNSNQLSVKTTTSTAEISFKRTADTDNIINNNQKIIFIITLEDERYFIKLVNSTTNGINSNTTTTTNSSDSDDSDDDSDDSDDDSDDSDNDNSDDDSDSSSNSDEDDTEDSSDEENVCRADTLDEESVITAYEVSMEPAESSSNTYTAEGKVIGVQCSEGLSYSVYVKLISIKNNDTFLISGHSGYGNGTQYSNLRLDYGVNSS